MCGATSSKNSRKVSLSTPATPLTPKLVKNTKQRKSFKSVKHKPEQSVLQDSTKLFENSENPDQANNEDDYILQSSENMNESKIKAKVNIINQLDKENMSSNEINCLKTKNDVENVYNFETDNNEILSDTTAIKDELIYQNDEENSSILSPQDECKSRYE